MFQLLLHRLKEFYSSAQFAQISDLSAQLVVFPHESLVSELELGELLLSLLQFTLMSTL